MKLLWLNAGLLLPLDKGGKLRTWHLMRHLARRHEISYLSFRNVSDSPDDIRGMREVAAHVLTVPRSEARKGTARFYLEAGRYLADRRPYAVAKYRSLEYRHALERLLKEQTFDAIVCDFLVPIVNLPDALPCPAILFTHNVEAEIWRRHAETAHNPIARFFLGQQWRRMLRFERAALGRFDLVLAVSDADGQTFERLYPGTLNVPVHVVQTGVDTTFFAPRPATQAKRAHLVFTGSMDWLPNVDGMQYFVQQILPRIREAEPGATLSIIGRSPTPAVKRLALDAGIEVTGRVDDVRPHIAEGSVYIVPLRIGGGTRLKIFEAMAMGKAVVSTTIGAEGLPVTPGEHVLVADDPAQFAQAVIGLIRDDERRHRLEAQARRLVVDRYDWAAVSRDFEDALNRVCRDGVAAA
jgi:sugar transferase (PEP-CTERM/EpsH1 system associated)